MMDFEKKNNPAELNEDELEMVSGGEYGDLLRPILTTYKAICACGYQETVKKRPLWKGCLSAMQSVDHELRGRVRLSLSQIPQ